VDEVETTAMPAIEERPAPVVSIALDIEVVPDDIDLLVAVALGGRLEEGERVRGAALDHLAEHAASPDF
jgi:hypothetical protein